MKGKVKIKLGNVQETLLLPLWGRAVETQKARPILVDPIAVEIIDRIDYDFSRIARNINKISQMAWIARSLFFDGEMRAFLQSHPDGSVVNLGCGLDTTFERVDNGRVHWYDLDLPDVIDLRRRFIQESERRRFIAASALDRTWHGEISSKGACMFLAGGFLYFFDEDTVRALFQGILADFPGFEMVFDYSSPGGVRVANRRVMQGSGMNTALQWSIPAAQSLHAWDNRIQVLSDDPIFAKFKKNVGFKDRILTTFSNRIQVLSDDPIYTKFKKYLGFNDQILITFSDLLKIMSLAHIKSSAG